MFELVLSGYMRDFFNRTGFEFTDFQKATLIWNAPYKEWRESLENLMELADLTSDEIVKKQIHERIAFEEKKYKMFQENSQKQYVYVVTDRTDNSSCGFFSEYNAAVTYARKYTDEYETRCAILKQKIIQSSEDQIVRNSWRGNPNLGLSLEEYEEYYGNPVSEISLNDSGNIATIDSNELPKEDEEFVNEYRTDRFEFSFLKIPFDMQVGTVVRDIPTGEYYVLAQGKEEWNKYIKRIDEQKLYVDFSDVQVVAYRLTERGYWSHDHINPLYIEPETLEHKPDSKKHNALKHALESLGTYLKDQSCGKPVSGEAVIAYSLEYAERCLNREERLEFVLRATAVENILW